MSDTSVVVMTSTTVLQGHDPDPVLRGRGPVLLLAHGAGGGIAGNFGLVLDDLATDHTVIGPHMPGSMTNPRATTPLHLDDLADALVAAAVTRGYERFAVLGESLGSAVAVRAARRHPERVTALVLTAGFPVADPVLATAAQLIGALDRRDDIARLATVSCMSDAQLAQITPQQLDAAVAAVATVMPAGTVDHFELAARVDVRADLPLIRARTLVVVPTGDRLVLPASGRRLADGITGARLVELPGAAHVLDEPDRAQWLRIVRAFLAESTDPAASGSAP